MNNLKFRIKNVYSSKTITVKVVAASETDTVCSDTTSVSIIVEQCATFFMAALYNRAGHYTFALWFLSIFYRFSSPNLSCRRLDVYHTSTHGVALVRI